MPKPATTENGNRPVHTLRHRRLKAAIWRNHTDKGVIYNVIVTRSYRDKTSEQWHDTHSLGYDDLMNVVALLQEAHTCISALEAKAIAKEKQQPPQRPSANRRPTAVRGHRDASSPGVADAPLPF